MTRPTLLALLAMTYGCTGCPGPIDDSDEINFFWRMTQSTVQFGTCTDDPDFREDITPIEIGDATYLIYRVSEDGKSARALECTHVDPKTCSTHPDASTWSVAGGELSRSVSYTDSISPQGCNLTQNITELILAKDDDVTFSIANTLTLSDETPGSGVCDELDNDIKASSPNGFGFKGCVITRTIKGERAYPNR